MLLQSVLKSQESGISRTDWNYSQSRDWPWLTGALSCSTLCIGCGLGPERTPVRISSSRNFLGRACDSCTWHHLPRHCSAPQLFRLFHHCSHCQLSSLSNGAVFGDWKRHWWMRWLCLASRSDLSVSFGCMSVSQAVAAPSAPPSGSCWWPCW